MSVEEVNFLVGRVDQVVGAVYGAISVSLSVILVYRIC